LKPSEFLSRIDHSFLHSFGQHRCSSAQLQCPTSTGMADINVQR
jgi:hypothetical protein